MKDYWQRPNRHSLTHQRLLYHKHVSSELKPRPAKPAAAIDTETYHGEARLISDSFGNYLYDADIDGLLHFLTHQRFRTHHVFSYNLQYDAEAVLKMLPKENLNDLMEDRTTTYSAFTIKYIPKKLLTIKDRHRNTARFFDIAQFFEMKLETAVSKYLNMHKLDYPHTARLNTDLSVWKEDFPDILKYNLNDSYITGLLAAFLQENLYHLFQFNPRSYISKASLAKDLVRIRGYIPDVLKLPVKARQYAFYAYKGGRFEVCARGYFPDTRLYDITSAYPFQIRDLIDVTYGEWKKVTDMHDEAHYGFYLCKVFVMPAPLCPMAYLLPNGVVCFPAGWIKTYLTKQEIEAYQRYADITVLFGWEFYPSRIRYPFRKYIDLLFSQKKQYEKTDYKYDLVKKMMNSLYGCFYEKNPDGLKIKTGILFNPAYASIITANTRAQLFTAAKKHERQVIALQTDSILFDGAVSMPESKDLGGWQLESKGKAVVLQSGIYRLDDKIRLRGMQKARAISYDGRQYPNVFDMIEANPEPTKYEYVTERPHHLRECMRSTKRYTKDDINVWIPETRTLNINADLKKDGPNPLPVAVTC